MWTFCIKILFIFFLLTVVWCTTMKMHNQLPFQRTTFQNHINSFHPSISHYRREHAPNCKYLPPKLKIKEMYADFKESHSGVTGYDTYRREVSRMNISFVKLGEEECELCIMYDKHIHDHEDTSQYTQCSE